MPAREAELSCVGHASIGQVRTLTGLGLLVRKDSLNAPVRSGHIDHFTLHGIVSNVVSLTTVREFHRFRL